MNIIKDIERAVFDILNSDRHATSKKHYCENPKQEEELLARIYNLIKKQSGGIDFSNCTIEKKEGDITSSGTKRQIYLLGNSEKEIECAIIFKMLSNKLKRYVNRHMVSRDTQIEILIEKLKVPKVKQIYSCDISDFYGSINHKKLKEIVNLKLDLQVYIDLFNEYLKFSDYLLTNDVDNQKKPCSNSSSEEKNKRGLPQGLSPSNLLAELYAIHIKNRMEMLLLKGEIDASVYRYADDFRIIFSDTVEENEITEIIKKIEEEFCVNFRTFKSDNSSANDNIKGGLIVWEKNESFDYLGYKFIWSEDGKKRKRVKLQISEKKIEKIKEKVLFALEQFNSLTDPIYIDYNTKAITNEEVESQLEPYKKIFLERIKDIMSVKIFKKGKHTIHTGVSYTYRKISDKNKGIIFKEEVLIFLNRMKNINGPFIRISEKEITLELLLNQKLFYIDKSNYISKHKLILILIDLDYTNQYTYPELRDKTYYEIYSLYQNILWNKKNPL